MNEAVDMNKRDLCAAALYSLERIAGRTPDTNWHILPATERELYGERVDVVLREFADIDNAMRVAASAARYEDGPQDRNRPVRDVTRDRIVRQLGAMVEAAGVNVGAEDAAPDPGPTAPRDLDVEKLERAAKEGGSVYAAFLCYDIREDDYWLISADGKRKIKLDDMQLSINDLVNPNEKFKSKRVEPAWVKPDFTECLSCAAKPGSPPLCSSCLSNRNTIGMLKRQLRDAKQDTTDAGPTAEDAKSPGPETDAMVPLEDLMAAIFDLVDRPKPERRTER